MLKDVSQQLKISLVHGAIAGFEGQVMTIYPESAGCDNLFLKPEDQLNLHEKSSESILGVPSITPVFIASLQAMEVVKIILRRGNLLNGRILYSDIELSEFNHFDFKTKI
ncbi:MAG: hypothetical protein HF978_16360 [Desulfobacteraceae bacterium]|nr:ThiF family adenylyltransferase [Desulfobacteraceae bacterium]MBC2757117.1 hypothetical protein [Desulfobacteraceae bacterium]